MLKLGSQEYAFALDAAAPKAKRPDAKQTAAKAAGGAGGQARSGVGRRRSRASKPAIPLKDVSYNRLYFDFNRNGDLTDDKVVELPAEPKQSASIAAAMSYLRFEFPRTDVTIDVDGAKLDYSFYLKGYAYASANYCTVLISVSSAICREGDITLEGKRHHLVCWTTTATGVSTT